jgi:predicted DNA-binding WGR domain protein
MRRFELSEGTSNKFWQVERDDTSMRVSFGRIGTAGQTQVKSFASSDAAQAEIDKLVKPEIRAVLAAGFERPEWCDSDIAAVPAGKETPHRFWPLLASTRTFADAKALLARTNQANIWYFVEAMDELRFDMIARYGESAAALFRELVSQAGGTGVERVRALAEGLAPIPGPDVLELLVTTFRELRAGRTVDGQAMDRLSVPMSTAEAVSVAYALGVRSHFLRQAEASPADLVECLVGAAIKTDAEDVARLRRYFEQRVSKQQGANWRAYYEARHRLPG